MRNGRCKFHSGKSTGARAPEGLERISKPSQHGFSSAAAVLNDARAAGLRRQHEDHLLPDARRRGERLSSPCSARLTLACRAQSRPALASSRLA